MKDSAQVIIIEGGIIACSAAYHLTSMGWKDVVIVEKGHLTSGGYGYTVGKTIAYGYIPFEEVGSDGRNQIEVYGEVFPANREPHRALYDPERKKILM